MQAKELLSYINNPQLLDKKSVEVLQKLADDFPYFQSAHILLSMASKKWDASVYQQRLKKTAIVVTNRAHLFELIHGVEEGESIVYSQESKVNSRQEAGESAESIVKSRQETGGSSQDSVGSRQEEVERQESIVNSRPESIVSSRQSELSDAEEATQELDILKAAEVSVESQVPQFITEEQKAELAEEQLEKEIGNHVVTAFVEKEILKTPEANRIKIKGDQPGSFGDWLSFLKKNNGQSYSKIEEEVKLEKAKNKTAKDKEEKKEATQNDPSVLRKQKNKAIIDKIIETSPGLIRHKEETKFYTPDLKAKESLLENEHLVTETLARIYALQGSVNKAVRAYEILSLKYPQKSAYFATLIQKLKNQ